MASSSGSIATAQLSILPQEMRPYATGLSVPVRGKGPRKQTIPQHQTGGYIHTPTLSTIQSQFPTNLFSSGASRKSSILPRIDFIKHLTFKVTITLSAPATLVPSMYWFTDVWLRHNGSNQEIQHRYDDASMLTTLFTCPTPKQRSMFMNGLHMEHRDIGKYGLALPLPAGTHTFYVPFLTSVFENFSGLYLQDMTGELIIDVQTPSTIIASGAGTITNTDVQFLVEGTEVSGPMKAVYQKNYRDYATMCNFLQAERAEYLNKTLTAGQVNKFPLTNINGLCAFQVMLVRPTGVINNNNNFATWNFLNVGDSNGASIDLTTSSGESLLGKGSPINTDWMRQHQASDQFFNDFVSQVPVYVVPYTESVQLALRGQVKGARMFDSTRSDEIRLTLPPAPVKEVQTITLTGGPVAGGYFWFRFREEESVELPYNATPAQIQAAIEDMREVKARNLTVVASSGFSALAANGSLTLTFTDPQGTLEGDLFEAVMDSAGSIAHTTRTVAGIPGLATGAYDVYIYSFMYKSAAYTDNILKSGDMVPVVNALQA